MPLFTRVRGREGLRPSGTGRSYVVAGRLPPEARLPSASIITDKGAALPSASSVPASLTQKATQVSWKDEGRPARETGKGARVDYKCEIRRDRTARSLGRK
jgi:hypothetical protein